MINPKFDDISPILDSELKQTVNNLIQNESFRLVVEPIAKPMSWDMISSAMQQCNTVNEFQLNIMFPILQHLIKNTTKGVKALGLDNFDKEASHLYISNHRDIVLDAAFLNIMLAENDMSTCEIAIGDNLLIYPWIVDLVRINRSFIVKRQVPVREMLATSKHLSEYIHDTIVNRSQSAWIAQREGRAKDSDDKTQVSLLKMLALYDNLNPIDALSALNIVPLSLSYEFDPCDYLKAKEFQQKRDNPEHRKSQKDDLINMQTGIFGDKGRVFFYFGKSINEDLYKIDKNEKRGEILTKAADIIDNEIHKNYTFFPINYIAFDRMNSNNQFADKYNKDDIQQFDEYIKKQVDKIDLPNKDSSFLTEKIIEMYANTVKNFLVAKNEF